MRKLANLNPKRVFAIFEEICSIPHGSGNTRQLAQWCVDFGEKLQLKSVMDQAGNVVIYKNGSAGREKESPVILQAHLDMVCAKEPNCSFDFTTQGICVETDGETVWANKTTLGADNGIGLAMILAVLEDNSLSHPPIEGVLTTDEEVGLIGAAALNAALLKGNRMINLDSEDEGIFTAGCAGGSRLQVSFPINKIENEKEGILLEIHGLLGGHSGIEIHKDRLNANVVMANLLALLKTNGEVQIASIGGGALDNAIAKDARCVLVTSLSIDEINEILVAERARIATKEDVDFTLSVTPCEAPKMLWNDATANNVLGFLSAAPNGVQSMCEDLQNVVETSLNLGITKSEEITFSAVYSLRSSVEAKRNDLAQTLLALAQQWGGNGVEGSQYPAWEYRAASPLRKTMEQVFFEFYNKQPITEVIHAGLECGAFGQKIQDLDAVSMGPNMVDVHTPNERVWVDSVERVYEYLCKVLAAL